MIRALTLLDSEMTYPEIWNFQKSLVERVVNGEEPETIIFCEHELSVTAGRRAKADNLLQNRYPLYEIERGGDFTLHAPGQLVVYPILRLNERFKGVREYLRFCEDIAIDFLTLKGLDGGRYGPTGVWVRQSDEQIKKIASIGIAVRRWVTYHGMALNVSNDLSAFRAIRPCDFEPSIMTSLNEQHILISMPKLMNELVSLFEDHLETDISKAVSIQNDSGYFYPREMTSRVS